MKKNFTRALCGLRPRHITTCSVLAAVLCVPLLAGAQSAESPSKKYSKDDVPSVYFGFATTYTDLASPDAGALRIDLVKPNTPAERAGLQIADHIVAFNGVPFRFENDAEAFRALRWAEPDKPIDLTVLRGHEALTMSLVPVAATNEQIQRAIRWLREAEATGRKPCLEAPDESDACLFELIDRVAAAGGKALVHIRRSAEPDGGLEVFSEEIHLPESFDWRAQWPSYQPLVDRLAPGETFTILLQDSEGRFEIGPLDLGGR